MANNTYEDFLRITGFEEEEMAEYLPEWRKASEKLGLTEEDVRFAVEERLPAHFALELEGIRKLLGCFVKETIDLTKATEYKQRGTKIVYGILPAVLHFYYALKLTAPEKIFVPANLSLIIASGVGPLITSTAFGTCHLVINTGKLAIKNTLPTNAGLKIL